MHAVCSSTAIGLSGNQMVGVSLPHISSRESHVGHSANGFSKPGTGETSEEGVLYVLSAKGLQHADAIDGQGLGSDAYAIVYLNDQLMGKTAAIEDSLDPEWNATFPLPLAPFPLLNKLRIEVFDHDDSLIDNTDDFMGMVMLDGEGARALPTNLTSYPLVKKRRLTDDQILHKGEYERYNACVGGKLQIRFLSKDAHEAHQHMLAGMSAVLATSGSGSGPLSLVPACAPDRSTAPPLACFDLSFSDLTRFTKEYSKDKWGRVTVKDDFADKLRLRVWQNWDKSRRTELRLQRRSGRVSAHGSCSRRKDMQPPALEDLGLHDMLKVSSNPALSNLTGFRSALAPLLRGQNWDLLRLLDVSMNSLVSLSAADIGSMIRLEVLYAHGNRFPDVRAAQGIAGCPGLRKLSLHGAPIETSKNYRVRVLALAPSVRQLDFTAVTTEERNHRLARYKSAAEETAYRKTNGKPSIAPAKALNETISEWLQLRSTSEADFRRRAKSRAKSRGA